MIGAETGMILAVTKARMNYEIKVECSVEQISFGFEAFGRLEGWKIGPVRQQCMKYL